MSPDFKNLSVTLSPSMGVGGVHKQITMKKPGIAKADTVVSKKGARRNSAMKHDENDESTSRKKRLDSARSRRKADSIKKASRGKAE